MKPQKHSKVFSPSKSASSSSPLTAADYFEFVNSNNLTSVINSKIDELDLGSASKYDVGDSGGSVVLLDSDGKIPQKYVPQIAITNTYIANSQSEMLGLSAAEVGDICIRNDQSKTYILKAEPYSTLANWQASQGPRLQGHHAEVRSLSQRRSWHDEPDPARRGLRHRRWHGDRSTWGTTNASSTRTWIATPT